MKLKSSDEKIFEVDKEVALELAVVKNIIKHIDIDDPISLSNISSKILAKVTKYCKYHLLYKMNEEKSIAMKYEINAWNDFFLKVDQSTLHDLLMATNYLNIKNLFELICYSLANIISNIELEEIQKAFNIDNDFTPRDEEEVRRENQWASIE